MKVLLDRKRNPALDPFGLCKVLGHKWKKSGYISPSYNKCTRCGATKPRRVN